MSSTTRAIGERQDPRSIFQVVIRSLEDHLPLDFGCICLYDPVKESQLALEDQARIDIDQNGLSRCVRGELVYEPDISGVKSAFPQRLARGGCGPWRSRRCGSKAMSSAWWWRPAGRPAASAAPIASFSGN